jgi:ABC-2 type transport system ATP-binding protein
MISINELSKSYGELLAVDRISLEIPEGQVLGLLGPNGAGKSTTLRILTGYLQPSQGTVYIDGNDVRTKAEEGKALIGYLPESSPLYPDMLVYDYLEYIAESRNLPGDRRLSRIRELAGLCGIEPVMHKSISSLSKGYRQRVGLALAMMGDPKILVLDEPTSGLDPNQIGEIRDIIREIGKEKTVIFSTHILSEAEATCDRIVIINKGQIVADGAMEELLEGRGEAVLSLHLKGADREEAVSLLQTVPGVLNLDAEENRGILEVRVRCRADLREEIYRKIREKDWILMELHQTNQSLEDLFRVLTLGEEGEI